MRSKKRRGLVKRELERTKRELENIVQHNYATMTESNSITKSAFSSSTPNIFSLSTSSTPRRNRSSFRNDTHHTDYPSVKVDHLASDVSNVGGATAFSKQKGSYDLKFPPSPKDRNGTVFSHSVGTINSLAYPTSSTKHKMHHSSSNSMSSLDALNSKDPLKRDGLKITSSFKSKRTSVPERNSSFNTGGATKQIVALASPAAAAAIDLSANFAETRSLANDSFTTAASTLSIGDFCKICHCGSETNQPLIAPCFCCGSLKFVHQECLQKWIKSSDIKRCELCKYPFDMQAKVKPFCQWEKLDMSSLEKRKLFCSVTFHMVAITCVVWSLYVLIDRTAEEVRLGDLAWPFWTKLVVVAIGFTGGLVFMYIQCKVYVHLCRKWKAYNRIIVVQDAPEGIHKLNFGDKDITDNGKDAALALSYSSSASNNNDLHSGIIHNEDSRRNSNVVGSRISPLRHIVGDPIPSTTNNESIKKSRFNDQESPIDCDESDVVNTSTNRINTTTLDGLDTNILESLDDNTNQPCKTKTNAETQTALRGVSLMEMIQCSTNSSSNKDDSETGNCHNVEASSGAPGSSKVKLVAVSNILDKMQTHSLNDLSCENKDSNVVQGAAIFFTECECTNNIGHSSKEKKSNVDSTIQQQNSATINEDQTLKGQLLPGSPVEDVNDPIVKTEKTLPINVTNTIVSPLAQKKGQK